MKKALRPGFKLTDLKNLYLDNSKQKRKMKENKKRNERKCKIDNKRFGHILTLNNPEVCGLSSILHEICSKLKCKNDCTIIYSALTTLDDLFDQDIPLNSGIVNQLKEVLDKLIEITEIIDEVSLMRLTISNIDHILFLDNKFLESFSKNNYQLQQIFKILHWEIKDFDIIYYLFHILSVLYEINPNEPNYNNLIQITLFYKKDINYIELNQVFYSIFENYFFHSATLELETLIEILDLLVKDLNDYDDPEKNLFSLLAEVFQKCKFKDFLPIFVKLNFSPELLNILSNFSSKKPQVVGISLHYFEILLLAEITFDHQKLFEEICKYLVGNKNNIDLSIMYQLLDIVKLLLMNNKMIRSEVLFDKSHNFWINIFSSIDNFNKEENFEVLELLNQIVCYYRLDFYNYSVEIDDSIFLWLKRQLYSEDESFLISVIRLIQHIVENDTNDLMEICKELSSIKDKLEIIYHNSNILEIKDLSLVTYNKIKRKYYQ